MRDLLKCEDFLRTNKELFKKKCLGRRQKAPRAKPRNRAEFMAIGHAVIAAIRKAEREGRFLYDPKKGLKIVWKNEEN